jgi:hypothetical protein
MKRHLLHRLFVCAFVFAPISLAQTNTSVVEGRVTDPSGAVISGCSVVLAGLNTGSELTTRTNETGTFVFPVVPVGSYTLKAIKEGFKTYALSDFRVTVGQRVTQDIKMELGTMAQSVNVEVADSAPLLEPSSNELGTLIESVNVQQLPLNGRN